MMQEQTSNKDMRLLAAATLTNCMNLTLTGLTHDQAEALVVTQFERFDNLLARALMPNAATMPDGSVAHPPGVFDDPPASDPVQALAAIANNPTALATLASNPTAIASLTKMLAPLLALIPGPAGVAVATVASTVASLAPIAMPTAPKAA
jgi:hypothetical protein